MLNSGKLFIENGLVKKAFNFDKNEHTALLQISPNNNSIKHQIPTMNNAIQLSDYQNGINYITTDYYYLDTTNPFQISKTHLLHLKQRIATSLHQIFRRN